MIEILHFSIHEVVPYIDWLYFFHAWGFPSRLASIAKVHGCEACRKNWLMSFAEAERGRAREAMKLYDEAWSLLREVDQQHQTHAIIGVFEANSRGDSIIVRNQDRTALIPFLRQQTPGESGYCLCLSDFIRPEDKGKDQIGIFACCVDREMEETETGDEYRRLLRQTMADRLAEATAERAHESTRKSIWGFAPDESLTVEEMLREDYQGLRPAVGYPSIPDQSIAFIIDELLTLKNIGISLTESGAMRPHASTCGFIFSHPSIRHFGVGKISEEQLEDYASRRGYDLQTMRKFVV